MATLAHRIKGYQFTANDRLFFDTNIWIILFGPPGEPGDTRAKTYSNAFKKAREAGSTLVIDVLVLSEFVNRSLRLEYNQLRAYGEADDDYKRYRASQEYAASVRQVARTAEQILSFCQPVESGFTSCDLTSLLMSFASSQSDLNDQFIVEICRRHNLLLLTDDGDFQDSGLTILTRNSSYFRSDTGNTATAVE
jgi:predicted nucleic acid-binding protein